MMKENETSKLSDAVNSALQERDTRVIRKRITQCAHRGDSLLGELLKREMPSMMSSLIRSTLQQAEYDGLSGEDTYTLMTYRVLVMAEKFEMLLLREHMQRPYPIMPNDPQVRP